jgi:hypothetical protein
MNAQASPLQIEATAVRFFSQGDEAAFFAWLDRVSFVERYEGRGLTLHIFIKEDAVDEEGLREILALFRRYGVPLRQLAALDRDAFASWFHDERAYWYKEIFG